MCTQLDSVGAESRDVSFSFEGGWWKEEEREQDADEEKKETIATTTTTTTQTGNALVQAAKANVKAAQVAVEVSKAHTFVVYTRNTQRANVDVGAAGPSLGDETIASGDLFENANATGAPAGRFDLTSITTALLPGTTPPQERRKVLIELAFNPGAVPNFYSPIATFKSSLPGFGGGNNDTTAAAYSRALASSGDSLQLVGVETYPLGGGLPTAPVVYAVTGGTGALVGARGQALIDFDSAAGVFRYTLMLL